MMIKLNGENRTVSLMDFNQKDIAILLASLDYAADDMDIKMAGDLRDRINTILTENEWKGL